VIEYSRQDDELHIRVQVVPRSSRSEIVGEHNGALKIRLAAPPVEGAANEELIRLVATRLKVSRGAVQITSGRHSKAKHLKVTGAPQNFLELLSGQGR
jgi:uncharacterized protein (TIGR00251 family)